MVVILENRCWQYYKNLDSKTWEICIDGIVNRSKEVIPSLISYKYNSRKINNGITYGTNSIKIKQQRFMSTSIEPSAAEKYAQKVLWEINVPAKTKASFIEGYNVERESEAELLIQMGSKLLIKDAKYDFDNKRWRIYADLVQDIADSITK